MFHPVAAAPSPLSFTTHTTASSICNATYQHLIRTQAQEINTHLILSYILKLCIFEGSSPIPPSLLLSSPISVTSGSELSPSPPPLVPGSLWIAGWSGPPHNRSLRFIVSLTQGQTGQHPLFVVELAPGTMDASYIRPAMNTVVTLLVELDPTVVGRVYAVFGGSFLNAHFEIPPNKCFRRQVLVVSLKRYRKLGTIRPMRYPHPSLT